MSPGSPFRARRRDGGEWVIGPVVLRVSSAQLALNVEVAGAPETSEIARDLHRPLCWRQQMQRQRDAAGEDTRRVGEPEHLLEPNGERRRGRIAIIDRNPGATRHDEVRRRELVEGGALPPVESLQERGAEIEASDIVTAAH